MCFRRNFIKSKRNEPKLLHSRRIRLPHQIEPAMAYQYGLPLLLIKEKGVSSVGTGTLRCSHILSLKWDSTLARERLPPMDMVQMYPL